MSSSSYPPHIESSLGSNQYQITLPPSRENVEQRPYTGPYALYEGEKLWRSRYSFLERKGYILRRRYHPAWEPSWTMKGKTVKVARSCEDSIPQLLPIVLDAYRASDGVSVCLKAVERKPHEVKIARYLSSPNIRHLESNHCVPIFDSFQDPIVPHMEYLVMPLLRPFNDPEFGAVDEIVDFVTQVMDGLAFMHEQGVAHGDCTGANVMMDAHPILPGGWHFIADDCDPDGFHPLRPLSRTDHPVRYYFIDFDLAHLYAPGESRFVDEAGGRDSEVPELARSAPWDLYKIDIFTVGNMFNKDIFLPYHGLDFLTPLITAMKRLDPESRPSAEKCRLMWISIKDELPLGTRWRLKKRDETVGERVVLDTMDVALQGLNQIRRLFKDDSRSRPVSPP